LSDDLRVSTNQLAHEKSGNPIFTMQFVYVNEYGSKEFNASTLNGNWAALARGGTTV
jgi:hypothetical protein